MTTALSPQEAPARRTVLVMVATLPEPPRGGSDMRSLATVRALASAHDVVVFGLTARGHGPPKDSEGIAWRVSDAFTEDVDRRLADDLSWLREPEGHPSDQLCIAEVARELEALIADHGIAIVVVESLVLQSFIRPLQAFGCGVILNSHGVESSLLDQLAVARPGPMARLMARRTRRVEERAYVAADQVWLCSRQEVELARARFRGAGAGHIRVVPNVVEVDGYRPGTASTRRFWVTFPASFGYVPNQLAAARLTDAIFPALVTRIPGARLALVGRQPSSDMRRAAASDRRIEVTGAVDEIGPYLRRADALAVPLREGHGTRLKILEAFAAGVPVVSSRKGVEGLDVAAGREYLVAESDEDFVRALTRLADDSELRLSLADAGRRAVEAKYSLRAARQCINDAITAVSLPDVRSVR